MSDAILNGWMWRLGPYFFAQNSDRGERSARRSTKHEFVLTDSTNADDPLVTQLKSGDERALLDIVRDHGAILETVAFVTVRDDDLARDIVQDVCFDLWQRRSSLEIRGSLLGYLRRAVHHRAVSVVRRERTQRRTEDALRADIAAFPQNAENLGPVAIEEESLARVVRHALDALPPRCREIFLLHREGGLEYSQIADLLSISLPTVYNQMHRALKHLAKVVAQIL